MTKDTGGPAFPHMMAVGHRDYAEGLTLRDWFAGQALSAMISKSPFFDTKGENGKKMTDILQFRADIAASAYQYADAMLAERSKP